MDAPKSISDDDLCSDCAHCRYEPGELSACVKGWPGEQDEDGYFQTCAGYEASTLAGLKALGFPSEADYAEHQRVMQASRDLALTQTLVILPV